jgi:hypothetical protein
VKFLSYQEWRALEVARLTAANESVDCKSCDGDGEKECECTCGHCHIAECEECDGVGSLIFKDLSPATANELYVGIKHYEKVVLQDAKQLAAYMVRDVFELLVEAGFQPWMRKWKHEKHIHLIAPEAR